MKILVVEDDEANADMLACILCNQNYTVEVAKDGEVAWELIVVYDYDLLLIDITLPHLDGISLCRRIRTHSYQMPILLVTGRSSSHDQAIGLDAGADAYMVKPFDHEVLIAGIRALLRRRGTAFQSVLEWGSLRFDPATREVTYAGQPLYLSPKEFSILEFFLRNGRRVFTYSVILDQLWAYEETPGEDAVRTHIKGLRQKFRRVGAPTDLIETVYGLGYRLKPLEAIADSISTDQFTSSQGTQPIQQQTLSALSKVWDRFKTRVDEQIRILEQASAVLMQQMLSPDIQQQASQEAHTLSDSLATFGLSEGSRIAEKIEQLLRVNESLKSEQTLCLCELVTALRQEIDRASNNLTTERSEQEESVFANERPLLLIIDADRQLAEQLVNEAVNWGFRSAIATTLSEAETKIEQDAPTVVLLDPDITHPTTDSLRLLAKLSHQTPAVPVLVLTSHDQLTDRLEVAQLGGHGFLHKPLPPAHVLKAVAQAAQRAEAAKQRVMVIDDDPQILATLKGFLEPWGLSVTTLNDPQRFWETLESCSPDLLILDMKMPDLSGVELCQIIRNDSHWGHLPIIFLIAHTDATIINQVFSVGADDFVSKPIVNPELVSRIINRLERIKLLQNAAETDHLTKLSNRRKSTQDLNKYLQLANQQNQPLCLAVLDLDNFKEINDRHGYNTGDMVMRQWGQFLRQTFRQNAVIARWESDEFVVALSSMIKADGIQRLTQLLATLHHRQFVAPDQTQFRITFSAGIAQYPDDGTDLHSLYQAASEALHQSKVAGCACIFSAEGSRVSV
ncbi:response regulator (plasmid) [Nostoc sp. C052]|uniref:response regulator n=1 Tax=Nostoc sp. C052 TaxID=2576902 RepID=UPI0015C300F4|nr:response regulator [Nostoc sp. C052]QLE46247.1 response regulator [Nostoc sp. C052]